MAMHCAPEALPATHFFDLIVIGSGPAALAVVARILESRPAALYTEDEHAHLHWLRRVDASRRPLLQTRRTGHGQEKVVAGQVGRGGSASSPHCECEGAMRILVVDRLGAWLANWDRLFAAYRIPHLRSPMFFHPAPSDIEALLAYAHRTGRTATQQAGEGDGTPAKRDGKTRRRGRSMQRRCAMLTEDVSVCDHTDTADLVEISGCVGKEVSKHKQKRNRVRKCATHGVPRAEASMGPAVNERDRRDYFTPSTALFRDFIQDDIVKRYGLDNGGERWPDAKTFFDPAATSDDSASSASQRITLVKGGVADLSWGPLHVDGWEHMDGFCVKLDCGVQIGAKGAVCAIGPGATPMIPDYLEKKKRKILPCRAKAPAGPGWCHSTAIGMHGITFPPPSLLAKARTEENAATTLVVIGGGLTSAQICDVAIRSGVPRVLLMMRSQMKVKPFDVGLEWIGRYANLEKMRFWQEDDPEMRLHAIREARNGGSITPSYAKLLRNYEALGRLQIHTSTKVVGAEWKLSVDSKAIANENDGYWLLETDAPSAKLSSTTIRADYVVAATGAAPSFSGVPFLSAIAKSEKVPEYGGLPWLSDSLQYSKLPLFCTGAFSALQIGPGAFNLEGMRAAADRIAVRLQEMIAGEGDGESDDCATASHELGTATSSSLPIDDRQYRAHTKRQESSPSFTHFSFQHLPVEVES